MLLDRLTYHLKCAAYAALLGVAPLSAAYATHLPWLGDSLGEALPWLSDPLNAGDKIKPFVTADRIRPAACPAIPPEISNYTLEQVVVLSLCNNPSAKLAYLTLVQQANNTAQTYSAYFPQVSATASWSRNTFFSPNSSTITRGSGLSAQMTIYDFGQRELNIEVAEQTLRAAGYSYDSTLQGVIAAALQGYYQLLTSQDGVLVAEESQRFAEASFEAASLRHEVGLVALADKLQAQSSLSQALLSTQQAYNRLAQDKAALARLMGLPPRYDVSVADLDDTRLTLEPFGGELDELLAEAKAKRVDLIAQRIQLDAARTSLRRVQRQNLATITAGVSAGVDQAGIFRGGTTRDNSIGVSVSIPIFTGFSQTYSENNAKVSIQSAEEAVAQTELSVAQDVWNAWHNFDTAQRSWYTSLDLLDSASQFKDVALGRYKEGIGTILDVLSAQSQYSSALQSQLQARYNLLTTRIDLVRAVGVLGLDTMQPEASVPLPPGQPEQPMVP